MDEDAAISGLVTQRTPLEHGLPLGGYGAGSRVAWRAQPRVRTLAWLPVLLRLGIIRHPCTAVRKLRPRLSTSVAAAHPQVEFVRTRWIRTSLAPNRFTSERLPDAGNVEVQFPGAPAIKMEMVTKRNQLSANEVAALHVAGNDWFALRVMSLWLFHTPPGATGLPPRVPVIASTRSV